MVIILPLCRACLMTLLTLFILIPPFNSNRSYNMMYKTMTGMPVPEQTEAFCDAWSLSSEDIDKLSKLKIILTSYDMDSEMISFWENWMLALKSTNPKLLSYLFYMMQRLFEMRRILKRTGSIYLHCDPTASHYIKVMMDGVFGYDNIRNQIIWCYKTGGRAKNHFPKKHDTILWYSKGNQYTFNYEDVSIQRDFSTMHEPTFKDQNGRVYQRNVKYGKEYRYYLDKGVLPNDYWTDIQAINPMAKERIGYPTQKPIALLKRIISASCPDGGIFFDPFCGCGSSIYAAQKTK